jgi:hypothetical protein
MLFLPMEMVMCITEALGTMLVRYVDLLGQLELKAQLDLQVLLDRKAQ